MARAGARLVEVGTTNRTHRKDYRAAVTAETGVILKVHTSNYRIQGFTAEVGTRGARRRSPSSERPAAARSGIGRPGRPYALLACSGSRPCGRLVAEGADLVTFSGDKLLGGPQAGFIVGRARADRRSQPQSDEAGAARRQGSACGDRGDPEALPRPDRLAERLPTLRFLARKRQGHRGPGARVCCHPSPGRSAAPSRSRSGLREPDRIRRAAARNDPQRRSRHPGGSGGRAIEDLRAQTAGAADGRSSDGS